MNIFDNVTDRYEEFERDEKKKVLICSYRGFRGLESRRIIIVVNHLKLLKHYLPECISFSTAFLSIIFAGCNFVENLNVDRKAIKNVIDKWKNSLVVKSRINIQTVGIKCEQNDFEEPQPAHINTAKQLKRLRITPELYSRLQKEIVNLPIWPYQNKPIDVQTTLER